MRDYIAFKRKAAKQDKAETLYSTFRDLWHQLTTTDGLSIDHILADMKDVAEDHAAFSLLRGIDGEIRTAIGHIRNLSDVPAILVARLLHCHRRAKTLPKEQLLTALQLIESYLVRRAVGRLQARNYWQYFANLAHAIKDDRPLDSLKIGFARLPDSYRFPYAFMFDDSLNGEDIYSLRVCRHLLERLENHDSREPSKVFCSALIALFRPVPVDSVAAVSGLGVAHVRDICADLLPGVRLVGDLISFADEDFEAFVRGEGGPPSEDLLGKIAEYFWERRDESAYAATYLATALYNGGHGQALLDLIGSEVKPVAIGDPVVRRQVQLHRLQMAMKVCRETGNNVDAVLTLLIGADALKTDAAIRRTLIENPDLASTFAEASSTSKILGDPEAYQHHGPLLFHLLLASSRRNDAIEYREGRRQIRAWLDRRERANEEHQAKYPRTGDHRWDIGAEDIAAGIEATLRMKGVEAAVEAALRWKPRWIAFSVASTITARLLSAGETSLLKSCLCNAFPMTFTTAAFGRSSPWWFGASSYKAAPKDPPSSLVQLYASHCGDSFACSVFRPGRRDHKTAIDCRALSSRLVRCRRLLLSHFAGISTLHRTPPGAST